MSRILEGFLGSEPRLRQKDFRELRQVLESRDTWDAVAHGSSIRLDVLAGLMTTKLKASGKLSDDDIAKAVGFILRGLLEFDLSRLAPTDFQTVLLARLARLDESINANDSSLLAINADVARNAELDREQHRTTIDHIQRVLNRIAPGPAGRLELVVYLERLSESLDYDPWPKIAYGSRDLVPSIIERQLRVQPLARSEEPIPADEIAARCTRLVILGGPGAGKTWLTRRIARIACDLALERLRDGASIEDVEIPLYATCAAFLGLPGDVRSAAIQAAIDACPDLGSNHVQKSLKTLLGERSHGVVLVLDSLDEAKNADTSRLRLASNIAAWRLILSSRQSSWADQVTIEPSNDRQAVVTLLPLSYPDDVQAVIDNWYSESPDVANRLKLELRDRPSLANAATVPVVLAMFCLVATEGKLPEFQRDLYHRVVRRFLLGPWHGDPETVDRESCEAVLREWAWAAATNNPVTQLGNWLDEFTTTGVGNLREAERRALDHLCLPVGRPDPESDHRVRRFVHRTIQEHFVAEYVASRTVEQAAEILMPHLWFDGDWERAGPAALAAHPQREELAAALLSRADADGDATDISDLSAVDASGQVSLFLLRAAAATRERDWPGMADAIGDHRLRLLRHPQHEVRLQAVQLRQWPSSTPQAGIYVVSRMLDPEAKESARDLVSYLLQLTDSTVQRHAWATEVLAVHQTSPVLLALELEREHFHLSQEQLTHVFDGLIQHLSSCESNGDASAIIDALLELADTEPRRDKMRRRARDLFEQKANERAAPAVVHAIATLADTDEQRDEALGLLTERLAKCRDDGMTAELVKGIVELAQSDAQRSTALQRLLARLSTPNNYEVGWAHVDAILRLARSPEQRERAHDALVALLAAASNESESTVVVRAVVGLADSAKQRQRALKYLLSSLDFLTPRSDPQKGYWLIHAAMQLEPSEMDRDTALRKILPIFVANETSLAADWARGVIELADSDVRRDVALPAFIDKVERSFDPGTSQASPFADSLLMSIPALAVSPTNRRLTVLRLLDILRTGPTQSGLTLTQAVMRLADTGPLRAEAVEQLVAIQTTTPSFDIAWGIPTALSRIDLSTAQHGLLCRHLLAMLAGRIDWREAALLTRALVLLDPNDKQRELGLTRLLEMIPTIDVNDEGRWNYFYRDILRTARSGAQRTMAADHLVPVLASTSNEWVADDIARALAQLCPRASRLVAFPSWHAMLHHHRIEAVLAACRRTSDLNEWRRALPIWATIIG